MKITKTYDWQEEDFSYDTECEHCGYTMANQPGKDDSYFYNQVVPAMECPNCHQSSTRQASEEPLPPIAPEHDPNITK